MLVSEGSLEIRLPFHDPSELELHVCREADAVPLDCTLSVTGLDAMVC